MRHFARFQMDPGNIPLLQGTCYNVWMTDIDHNDYFGIVEFVEYKHRSDKNPVHIGAEIMGIICKVISEFDTTHKSLCMFQDK